MKLLVLLLVAGFCQIQGSRFFFRGKRFEATHDDPIDTELWFDQLLDHFEPTNDGTWKQVCRTIAFDISG